MSDYTDFGNALLVTSPAEMKLNGETRPPARPARMRIINIQDEGWVISHDGSTYGRPGGQPWRTLEAAAAVATEVFGCPPHDEVPWLLEPGPVSVYRQR